MLRLERVYGGSLEASLRRAAEAIAGVAGDRKKLVMMRVNSRRLAEREFDRETTYAAFADWIEAVRGGG